MLFLVIRFDILLYNYTTTHRPLIFKTLSPVPTHLMNIYAKFYQTHKHNTELC